MKQMRVAVVDATPNHVVPLPEQLVDSQCGSGRRLRPALQAEASACRSASRSVATAPFRRHPAHRCIFAVMGHSRAESSRVGMRALKELQALRLHSASPTEHPDGPRPPGITLPRPPGQLEPSLAQVVDVRGADLASTVGVQSILRALPDPQRNPSSLPHRTPSRRRHIRAEDRPCPRALVRPPFSRLASKTDSLLGRCPLIQLHYTPQDGPQLFGSRAGKVDVETSNPNRVFRRGSGARRR